MLGAQPGAPTMPVGWVSSVRAAELDVTDERRSLNPHRPVYVERVNASIDFIEKNLAEDLNLEQIAAVAHFSPFHFHRVFSLLVGETLSRFINRLRMERAATILVQQPARSITEVASSCGLHNPSSFSRSFREMFGVSASAWRTRRLPHVRERHGRRGSRCLMRPSAHARTDSGSSQPG